MKHNEYGAFDLNDKYKAVFLHYNGIQLLAKSDTENCPDISFTELINANEMYENRIMFKLKTIWNLIKA